MPKAMLLLAAVLLAGCSHEDRVQTNEDAKRLGRDIKQDVKKADEVMAKEARDARERIKRDVDNAKK